MTGRVLGVDYGDVRTGIAISDENRILAGGLCTIEESSARRLADKITEIALEHKCNAVVIGDPVNMDGSHGSRSDKAKSLAKQLKMRLDIPIELYDERRTTLTASEYLDETGTFGKKRKSIIDTLSAQIILQNYLDFSREH